MFGQLPLPCECAAAGMYAGAEVLGALGFDVAAFAAKPTAAIASAPITVSSAIGPKRRRPIRRPPFVVDDTQSTPAAEEPPKASLRIHAWTWGTSRA
jgi:hypothetical protein